MTSPPPTPARLVALAAREGRTITFIARGGSMWPAVRDGALVELAPCPAEALRAGEVAAFERGDGEIVVHRVLGRRSAFVRFGGDALAHPDPEVPAGQVLGRVRVLRQRPLRVRLPRWRHLAALARTAWRRLAA